MFTNKRLGWDNDGGLPDPNNPNLTLDRPVMILNSWESGGLNVAQDPSWTTDLFNRPTLMTNGYVFEYVTEGAVKVLQAGVYRCQAFLTGKNTQASSEFNSRFTKNGTEIDDSFHQTFESGDNSDRDYMGKGVFVECAVGDVLKLELNSNKNAQRVRLGDDGGSTWMVELFSGLNGVPGMSVLPEAISVYRSRQPTNQDFTTARNVFYNDGTSRSGTVSGTAGTKDVVGVGTTFTNLAVGDVIEVTGDDTFVRYYSVAHITNNTNLILDRDIVSTLTASSFNSFSNPKVNRIYDEADKFDYRNAVWYPSAGKYIISAGLSCSSLGDTDTCQAQLRNISTGTTINFGSKGRNEGGGDHKSVLHCQIETDGTEEFAFWGFANDSTTTIQGIDRKFTYFMAYRFAT